MTEGLRTAYRTCPLCEATCGLEITLAGEELVSVRGDAADVFSKGFICPKGVALKELHEDPDRIRTPLIRQADGSFEPAGWDEAFALIHERLEPILAADRNAVATYLGNPSAHNLSSMLYGPVLLKALGSRNRFSASTVDQFPKQLSSGLMFGSGTTVPVPDVDRTDHLLILGANPLASNGSLLTAPDMRGRLRAIRARGGKVVVVDPRRTRTAEEADEHQFIRPGTDAHLLMAMVNVLFAESLVDPGERIAGITDGIAEVGELCEPFTPEAAARVTGIPAEAIRRLARDLAAAPRAAVYGRIGTCTQEFGTLASWLVDVLNVLTGNLDREGGAMFPTAPAGQANTQGRPGVGRGLRTGRWQSRVRGLSELFGELPVAALAEEIDTPGAGRIRALITIAGNPVVSTPNSARLDAALRELDFMVSVDVYLNETTHHADVILPAPSPLRRSHFDLILYAFAVRNVANYSPPALEPEPDLPDEWVTLLRLTGIASGAGPDVDVAALDEIVARGLIERELALGEYSRIAGRTVEEVLAALRPRTGPERLLDLLLRVGPFGDGFGADANGDGDGDGDGDGHDAGTHTRNAGTHTRNAGTHTRNAGTLSLAALEAAPHGIDLGPLEPRLPDGLRTASGRIELAAPELVSDVARLQAMLDQPSGGADDAQSGLVLVGRRQLRSNNSWMHNLPLLVRGPRRCTLQVHPDDAAAHGLVDGEAAAVRSRVGELTAVVEVTDAIMPGVVSLPHGWGHDVAGTAQRVAAEHAGVNSNVLSDERLLDAPSGNAVLSGIPVELAPVLATA